MINSQPVQPERYPVRVFLDSADYSTLTDEKRLTLELIALRDRLIRWEDTGDVEFWYSGTILSEMAPVEGRCVGASVARTDLLVRLCNTQALISVDRILQYEFQNLSAEAQKISFLPVYSYSGEWFPELTDVVSPVSWLEGIRDLDVAARRQGLNRESRRKLHKRLFKKGQPTTRLLGFLTQQKVAFDEISQQYPMREQDAEVLWNYVMGKASASQATEAFLASLRDPRWMLRWFYNNSDKLSPITTWARSPSDGILQMIQQISETASGLKETSKKLRNMGLDWA